MAIRKITKFTGLNILAFILLINTTSCWWLAKQDDTEILPEDKVYTVKGFVFDSENQPVCNKRIILFERDENCGNYRFVKGETQTDDYGFYKIDFARHRNDANNYWLFYTNNDESYLATEGFFSFEDFGGAESLDFNIYYLKCREITLYYNYDNITLPVNQSLFIERKTNLLIEGKPYKLEDYSGCTNETVNKYFIEPIKIPETSTFDASYESFITICAWDFGNNIKKTVLAKDTIRLDLNTPIPDAIYLNDDK